MKLGILIAAIFAAGLTAGQSAAQSQPQPRVGNLDIWDDSNPEDHDPNPVEIATHNVTELNAFDLYALGVARSADDDIDFEIDIEDHLSLSNAAPEDPWERREAKEDFVERFAARVAHVRDTDAHNMHEWRQPVAVTRVDLNNYVFEIRLPRRYDTQGWLHAEPYALGRGARLHYGWHTTDEGAVTFEQMSCSAPAHGPDAAQDIPRNYNLRAPSQSHCSELPMPGEADARALYDDIIEQPPIVQAMCSDIRPVVTNRRSGEFSGDLACIMRDVQLLVQGRVVATWVPETGVWDYRGADG